LRLSGYDLDCKFSGDFITEEHLVDNVLIIDRAGTIAKPLAAVLADSGYQIDMRMAGRAALQDVDLDKYCLVIADTDVPGMEYAQLLSEIRGQAPHLPVIATAETGSVRGAVAAMQAGAVDYLLKPVHPESLVLALQKALVPADEGSAPVELPHSAARDKRIVTRDPQVRELLQLAENVAQSQATVLILGGKRHRQGAPGSLHSSAQPGQRQPLCGFKLCRVAGTTG